MQTRALIAMWVLGVVSCCAALVAFAFLYVSFTLAGEMLAARSSDPCYVPSLQTLERAWLISGVAGLLSWSCALVARRIASASPRGARRIASASPRGAQRTARVLLVLSSLTLIGLCCSLGFTEMTGGSRCIG